MKHIVNLLVGKGLKPFSTELFKYIQKYGEGESKDFSQVLSLYESDEGFIIERCEKVIADGSRFYSVLDNLFLSKLTDAVALSNTSTLSKFFANLYNSTVTINHQGDSNALHLNIYLPLYNDALWSIVKQIVSVLHSISQKYIVDIIGLSSDLAEIIEKEPIEDMSAAKLQMQTISSEIIELENNDRIVHRFLFFQNNNRQGVCLNLDEESFVRILGEYSLLTVERYEVVFPVTEDLEVTPITTFGLSVLWFDKYYYLYYLLRGCYIHLLEREKVDQDKVDITKVLPLARKRLDGNTEIFKSFFEKEVISRLNAGKTHETIVTEISPLLKEKIAGLTQLFQNYIYDDQLSLPEKQATLACILGLDDDLLEGYSLRGDELILDDCGNGALELFIQENNKLVHPLLDDEGKQVYRNNKPVFVGSLLNCCVDPNDGYSYLPLKEMKDLRSKMKECSTYIRMKTADLQETAEAKKESQNRKKRLTKEGFEFEGNTFKLNHDIEERPLAETYQVHKVPVKAVDLRNKFGEIRQQGSLGACTVFGVTSILEYMIKSSGVNIQLSPRFVYYNVAKVDDKGYRVDSGSSLYSVIESLEKEGVCLEELYPYQVDSFYNTPPTSEAINDAKDRLVAKAMNVELEHNAITSALSDGYPVAISLRIFDSFADNENGFVFYPSEQEKNEGNDGWHVMVICGFSEEEKVYIVRNSWGKEFGDNGYCYIPFSYIEDENLARTPIIITEINCEEIKNFVCEVKDVVEFDILDSSIKRSVLRILVDEQKAFLAKCKEKYEHLRLDYTKLKETLCIPSQRRRITEAAMERMNRELINKKEERRLLVDVERPDTIKTIKKETNNGVIRFLEVIGVTILIMIMIFYFQGIVSWITSKWTYYLGGILLIEILGLTLYYSWRLHHLKTVDNEFKERAGQLAVDIKKREKDLSRMQLKMHVAGMVCDSVNSMQNNLLHRYYILNSYILNLRSWLKEEKEQMEKMSAKAHDPFVSVLSNKELCRFLEENKNDLVSDIKLYSLLSDYLIEEETIQEFKNKKIKDAIIQKLEIVLQSFSMFKYLLKQTSFGFMDDEFTNLDKVMPLLYRKSIGFAQSQQLSISSNSKEAHTLFIYLEDQDEEDVWNNRYRSYFKFTPASSCIVSPYKLVMLQMLKCDFREMIAFQ